MSEVPAPTLLEVAPAFNEAALAFNEAAPAFNEAAPACNKAALAFNEAAPAGAATKNAAKKARAALFKLAKRRSLDDAANAKIGDADVALQCGRNDVAMARFHEATLLVMHCPKKVHGGKGSAVPTATGGTTDGASVNSVTRVDGTRPVCDGVSADTRDGGGGGGGGGGELDVDKLLPIPPECNTVAKYEVNQTCSYARNAPDTLAAHLAATGGRWQTRFPPEPNGYLHIGHAKAIHLNFLVADVHAGTCVLRFDDTNPAAEKQEYIDMIIDNLHWLGHRPAVVAYTSDYFQQLYDFAEQLVLQGDAYVCAQTKAEVKASRDLLKQFHIQCGKAGMTREQKRATPLPDGAESPYRNRSPHENLKLLREMRDGHFKEGEVNLRCKQDLYHDDGAMWDTGAYRVKHEPHPRTGSKWCIYPTYDYAHCICDSLENITHSLCTLEFGRRQSPDGPYYWLLDKLGLYKPQTWEYSRSNITCNVMSKRKLNELVADGHVSGWDDPRLFTLAGLRRRGYTAAAIADFCKLQGVTKNRNTTPLFKLERCIRVELEHTAKRVYGVVEPVRVVISNWDAGRVETKRIPHHPTNASLGDREVAFGKVLYIERSDVFLGTEDEAAPVAGFRGLTPTQPVRLLWSYDMTWESAKYDGAGKLVELACTVDLDSSTTRPAKGQGTIHWVADCNAVDVTLNLYDNLFTVDEPLSDEHKDNWLDFLNPVSLVVGQGKVEKSCVVDDGLAFETGKQKHFQFTRRGYFCVDSASTSTCPVLNRTTTLRE